MFNISRYAQVNKHGDCNDICYRQTPLEKLTIRGHRPSHWKNAI